MDMCSQSLGGYVMKRFIILVCLVAAQFAHGADGKSLNLWFLPGSTLSLSGCNHPQFPVHPSRPLLPKICLSRTLATAQNSRCIVLFFILFLFLFSFVYFLPKTTGL